MAEKKALMIIDTQVGLVELPVWGVDQLLSNLKTLLTKAREAGITVVYVQDGDVAPEGTREWEVHPDISPNEGDIRIQKFATDAFHGTDLHEELKAQGITDLVVGGCKTEYCVDTACRRATTLGYNVTLVSDAHSTTDDEVLSAEQIIAHHNCNLHGLDNLEHYIQVQPTNEIQF
ncbi:MAG TPA: cysteine hydrolase family protein [Bacillales bacterium]|nr:cysteine hydrolase family protein [Bacillales bacterium]